MGPRFVHRTPHGLVFEIDPADAVCREIYLKGLYDSTFLEWTVGVPDRRGGCLDIGANIGSHCLFLARTFTPVYAFEPNPTAYVRLVRNVRLNPGLDVRCLPIALSDSPDEALFYDIRSGHSGLSGFAENLGHLDRSRYDVRELRLRRLTGDTIVEREGIGAIALIKIDTEGHEARVIKGLAATIRRERPVIVFEWHRHLQPSEPLDAMRDLLDGYGLYELNPRRAPRHRSSLGRVVNRLRVGYESRLVPIGAGTQRTRDNIVAIHETDMRRVGVDWIKATIA